MCTFLSWWPAEPEEEGDVEEKNNKALPSEIPQSPQDTTPHSTTPPPQFIHWGRRTRFHYGLRCVQKGARHSSASPYLPPSLSLDLCNGSICISTPRPRLWLPLLLQWTALHFRPVSSSGSSSAFPVNSTPSPLHWRLIKALLFGMEEEEKVEKQSTVSKCNTTNQRTRPN